MAVCIYARTPWYFSMYVSMYAFASLWNTPMSCARENADMPYTMPKLTAFARERMAGVTSDSGTPNTWLAVTAWMSSPARKAAIIVSSCDIWASSRSSIWL